MSTQLNRIVIVDDAIEVRRLAEVVLKKGGFDTRTAASANEGFDTICAHKPDLVLLDVMMPGTSGLELYARLRANLETALHEDCVHERHRRPEIGD